MMAHVTKNLLVGLIAGLMMGLLVCRTAHADEMTCQTSLNVEAEQCHGKHEKMPPSPCEQMMVAAMRAMDEFMPTRVMVDIFHHTYPTVQKMDKKWMDDFTTRAQLAEQAWQLAKVQCWAY